jgi:dihydroxyacetone kinase
LPPSVLGRSALRLRMVVVDDDVALPDLPQARGVAGTLFVHKIAGALADQAAKTLIQWTKAAEQA